MTMYLLDTDIIEYLGDSDSPHHEACVKQLEMLTNEDELCVSILSLYELEYGIAGARASLIPRLQRSKDKILEFYTILPLTAEGSAIYGRLKHRFKETTGTKHRSMKTYTVDMIIASTALEHRAVLVSSDAIYVRLQELEPDLARESWSRVVTEGL